MSNVQAKLLYFMYNNEIFNLSVAILQISQKKIWIKNVSWKKWIENVDIE